MKNIHHAGGRYITIHCNAIKRRITKEATIKGYRTIWFDEGSITDILSFVRIREK